MICGRALFGISPWMPGKEVFGISRRTEAISPGLLCSPSDAISRVSSSSRARILVTLSRLGKKGSISAGRDEIPVLFAEPLIGIELLFGDTAVKHLLHDFLGGFP